METDLSGAEIHILSRVFVYTTYKLLKCLIIKNVAVGGLFLCIDIKPPQLAVIRNVLE